MCNAASMRKGFTLSEFLVVLGLVGALLSLAVPAVQRSRGAARRVECKNRLRQIGVALQSHYASRHVYPRGGDWQTPAGQMMNHSPHVHLLPHLGESTAYKEIDFTAAASNAGVSPLLTSSNKPVIPTFICPANVNSAAPQRNNYRANIGITAFPRDPNVPRNPSLQAAGAFYPTNKDLSDSSFPDGLSHTIGFAERVNGDGVESRYAPGRDVFHITPVSLSNVIRNSPRSEHLILAECESLIVTLPQHYSRLGEYWMYSGFLDTWYNHILTPNHAIPDCGFVSGISGAAVVTARSPHPGGVNCLFMDGRVAFIADTIAHPVWTALGTRNGLETADAF